jgi:NTP pyrophosphatase (non-canonical NTP hydrolase)
MTIQEFQLWVKHSWKENQGELPDKHLQLLFLIEEFGEVAEAIRKAQGDKDHKVLASGLEEEMGDFMIALNLLAVGHGIDMENAAHKAKEKIIKRHGV